MKLLKELKLKNCSGLHIRPATEIVKMLQNVQSQVFFTYKDQTVNAKSIISLLFLSAEKDAMIEVSVEGEDAEKVMSLLVEAFELGFGET